jgi:hypothetical protein|tara:strand:+ start:592 stop:780 length:189 start_codon:yes stop_codon:yes gene_type:complete
MTEGPTQLQKLNACSHYTTDAFKNSEWDYKCPLPPVYTDNWLPEDWVKWVDGQGSWIKKGSE